MALAGHHERRRVPLPPPRARRHALRRPERDGPRRARRRARRPGSGSRCSTPATCTAGIAALPRRATPARGPSARRRARRARRRRGSAPRSTACARSTRTPRAVVAAWAAGAGRCTPTSPSSRPRTRHASPRTARTPTALLADAGALGADFTAVHATHLTDDDVALLGGAARRLPLPDDRARPRRRHRARAARCADAGAALAIGTDSHAVIDLFEEARAIELDERLATGVRGTHRARRPAARRDRRRLRRARLARGRPARARRARRPHHARRSTPSGSPAPSPSTRPRARSFAATAADVRDVMVGGALDRPRRRATPRSTSPPRSRARSRRWRDRARRRQHRAARHQRRVARRGPARARPRRRAGDRGRPRRRGRARRRRGRRAHRRRRALRDPGLRRQPHAPRVRRRPRRRVRRAHGRRAVRGRRHPRDHRGDPRRVDRGARRGSPPPAATRRCRAGITHVEIKSGYGLDVATERRCCEVAARFTDDVTFLGAHVVPAEYEGRADDYVALVCGEMLAACAPHARWIDVFCEEGAFDADQSRAVLEAGRAAGLGLRVHANQLGPGPGRAARGRARRRLGRPLHLPDRRRRRRARRQRHRRDLPPRHRLLDPPALPRRPPRDRRRRAPSRSRPTATRARATRPRWRSASRSRSATCT